MTVRAAGPGDVSELVRLRHAMFRAMADTGAAGRPEDVEDTSWYAEANQAIQERMVRGVLGAFVIDAGPVLSVAGSDRPP
ncbi:hypothetical protein, partial [Arthrobacter sp. H41]|uniref:hypothetical protein n=1 Tax=Arthrobacter sp. H41 TaxID=1312978 RepID=UPI001C1E2345